jgi:hypothetical protein
MRILACLFLGAALGLPARAGAWGFATHRAIEELAIETLPAPLRDRFREHREEISDWSIEPDTLLREKNGRAETVKHFIDLDLYGTPPFPDLPRSRRAAVERFGEETVEKRGTVPWTIEEKHAELVAELRRRDWPAALRTAAYAGHYIADATMPLHAISDYDGQKSGSPGIHKAVEHDVVDQHLGEYLRIVRAKVGPAKPSHSIDRIFDLLFESYAAAPELMAADREARRLGSVGSPAYVAVVDRKARVLLTNRIARAVQFLGGFWLSAWQEAGQPDGGG